MTDKLLIKRELLERLAGNGPTSTLSATRELREILAAPRQPEGDAASILLPALRQYMHNDGSGLLAGYEYERTQQIVAELRGECERLRVFNKSLDEEATKRLQDVIEAENEAHTLRQQSERVKSENEHLARHIDKMIAERDTLRQQLAELRAGQEPVAYITGQFAGRCVIEAINRAAVLPTGMALYSAPQPSAVPDGWKLVPVEPTPEMVSAAEEAHMPFGDMDIALRMAILSAPSAPATVQGVNQQLLEALEELIYAHTDKAEALATAAIAAARKGEGE